MRKGWFLAIGLGVPVLLFTFTTLIWGMTDTARDAFAKQHGGISDHASPTARPPTPIPIWSIHCEKGFELTERRFPLSQFVFMDVEKRSDGQLEFTGIREERPLPGETVQCLGNAYYKVNEYPSLVVPRKFHFAFGSGKVAAILVTPTTTNP